MTSIENLIKKYKKWIEEMEEEEQDLTKQLNYLAGEKIKYKAFIKELEGEVS